MLIVTRRTGQQLPGKTLGSQESNVQFAVVSLEPLLGTRRGRCEPGIDPIPGATFTKVLLDKRNFYAIPRLTAWEQ